MNDSDLPEMSVIIVVRFDSVYLRWALQGLREQTIASSLECIVVTSLREEQAELAEALEGLPRLRIIELGPFAKEGEAKAAGVAVAQADLVSVIEDHSRPHARWAEALLEAHRQGEFAAVGPVVLNGNPDTSASWGCFLVFYGLWAWGRPQNEVKHLPANHSCYRRDVLLGYGPRLPDMLQAESVLHNDLLATGHRLSQDPAAKSYHLNYSRLRSTMRVYVLASHVFAAERAIDWGFLRRAVYALGSPLLPLIRLPRILADGRCAGLERRVLRKAIAPVILTLCAGAVGEMLGYSLGLGRAGEKLAMFETERELAFSARDLEAFARL